MENICGGARRSPMENICRGARRSPMENICGGARRSRWKTSAAARGAIQMENNRRVDQTVARICIRSLFTQHSDATNPKIFPSRRTLVAVHSQDAPPVPGDEIEAWPGFGESRARRRCRSSCRSLST